MPAGARLHLSAEADAGSAATKGRAFKYVPTLGAARSLPPHAQEELCRRAGRTLRLPHAGPDDRVADARASRQVCTLFAIVGTP
jgi:hypothetical protein